MNRQQVISLFVTALVAVFCLLLMVFVTISVEREPREWPPVHDGEVALAEEELFFDVIEEEYVPTQSKEEAAPTENELDEENLSTPAPSSGDDLKDAGKQGDAPDVQTTKVPSDVKETKQEPKQPAGPTKEELEQQETSRQVNSKTQSAFQQSKGKNNTTSKKGDTEGDSGSTSGSSTSFNGTGSGTVSVGWVMPAYAKVPSKDTGSLTYMVYIDDQGKVTNIRYMKGETPAASNSELRKAVENEIRRGVFKKKSSTATNAPRATVTYKFK